ncbi:MAG: sulfite exporter TauE/SafE family protein [Candidatus Helarchaeota archaeon]
MDFYLFVILIILACVVGLVLGMMAQSGSVIIVPFLFSFFAFSILLSMGTSLFVDLITASVVTAVYIYHRHENKMEIKLGILTGLFALCVSFIGSYLAFTLIISSESTEGLFSILFAGFEIFLGILLIRNATKSKEDMVKPNAESKIMDYLDRIPDNVKTVLIFLFAIIPAINSGLFAGSGGFFMVLLLMILCRYEIHKAAGTGVLFMVLTALGPCLFYSILAPILFPTTIMFSWKTFVTINAGVYVDYFLVLIIGIPSTITAFFASVKAQKISEKHLKFTLGIIVLVLNSIMLIQSLINSF